MKLNELNKDKHTIKVHGKSITVKDKNTLKTVGVINGYMLFSAFQFNRQVDINSTMRKQYSEIKGFDNLLFGVDCKPKAYIYNTFMENDRLNEIEYWKTEATTNETAANIVNEYTKKVEAVRNTVKRCKEYGIEVIEIEM